jgi:hypothetical protein
MTETITPNAPQSTGTESSAVPSLDSIAAKMTAMRETTLRNQIRPTEQDATGQEGVAEEPSSPVVNSDENAGAKIDDTENTEYNDANQEADAQETVSSDSNDNSTADELIDFIEFAETNPNAKFKFMKNGQEVVIDAKKAASILGQGSAIHEEARQLKIERAEFNEYLGEHRARQENLTLAMEFTVQPQLQKAYDEILKTQNYQTTFQQQMSRTQDPAQRARIQASMQQNEQYIRQQQQTIQQLQPAVEQFRQIRNQQVVQALDTARKGFQDKELKNDYIFNEVRSKLEKLWPGAKEELIPGVPNIDLLSSNEQLLSLVRDGLKYRSKPTTKSAGNSMAALTQRKGSSNRQGNGGDEISKLREQAKSGDKKAADNLLTQRLQSIRASRGGR